MNDQEGVDINSHNDYNDKQLPGKCKLKPIFLIPLLNSSELKEDKQL